MWDLVGNPKDRFSHNEAHIIRAIIKLDADSMPFSAVDTDLYI